MLRNKKHYGFTLVELSLSIAFIAILSISIVLIITNTISSYHRGLTLSQLNTIGMDLVDDMRSSIQSATARSVVAECSSVYNDNKLTDKDNCEKNNGERFVSVTRKGEISGLEDNYPLYGAFCTGNYSYIWNSGYSFSSDYGTNSAPRTTFTYRLAGSNDETSTTDFKLLKVKDESRSVCISAVTDGYNKEDISFDISAENYPSLSEEPIDLLDTDSSMAIYDIYSSSPADNPFGNELFYSVSFILGTVNGGINVKSSGNYCAAPSSYNNAENFDYCAINKFNFAAQAVGG